MPSTSRSWCAVIPVKDPRAGKTRLQAPPGVVHADLAEAIALDTVTAACDAVGADRVVVVTDTDSLCPPGCRRVQDPGRGLNPAILAGVELVQAIDRFAPVAVLLGDHPALTGQLLISVLARCTSLQRAVVPDADGTGTALLTALDPADLEPQFGPGSYAAHASRATPLENVADGIRIDVDDLSSLAAARTLGVGERTAAVLASAHH